MLLLILTSFTIHLRHLKSHSLVRNREKRYFEQRAITIFGVVILVAFYGHVLVELLKRFTEKKNY